MVKFLAFVGILFSAFICVNSASAEDIEQLFKNESLYDSSELIVSFKSYTTSETRQDIIDNLNGTEVDIQGDVSLIRVPNAQDLEDSAEKLRQNGHVAFVEPNIELQGSSIPKDSYFTSQWGLKKINLPDAWDDTIGETSIVVGVLDMGIDTSHSEFKGRITNPYDVLTGKSTLIGESHGTHVAGIIGAAMDEKGVVGVAPNVSILPVNLFENSEVKVFNLINGIHYAVDKGADIINLSLYTPYYSATIDAAIEYAYSKGVIVVGAVGNDGKAISAYPAANEHVIAVSATNKNDSIATYSNHGNYVDIAAPGTDILSTDINGTYVTMTGTSMATPIVSGVAALILSKNPFLSPDEVENILLKSSKDLGAKGKDNSFGYGRVDAAAALKETISPITKFKLSSSTLNQNKKNTVDISFYVEKGLSVSLYITNEKGKTIKTFMSNKLSNGGMFKASWNGLNDDGQYNYSGKLNVKVEITNGEKKGWKTAPLTIVDTVHPYLTANGSTYLFNAKKKLDIPFSLSKQASVKAEVYQSNGNKILTWTTKKSSGEGSISWDGKNSSKKQVSDGTYTINLTPIDTAGNKGVIKKVKVTVDSKAPILSVKATTSVFNVSKQKKIVATFTLKESAKVDVSIVDKKGKLVKVLSKNKSLNKGMVSWDGKKTNGSRTIMGTYYFKVTASDKAGNVNTKQSSFSMKK